MKKIINNFLLFAAVLLLFGACEKVPEPGGSKGDETEVEMRFSAPMTYAGGSTRAVDPEDVLQTMQILVFNGEGDNAEFLYRRTAIKKTGTDNMFRATLIVANGVTLRFAANASDLLASISNDLVEGNTWGAIKEKLILTESHNITVAGGLPMWGESPNTNIIDKEVNTMGPIAMLRSVASAEIKIVPDAAQFQLEEVWLIYAANKGYLHYNPELTSGTGTNMTVDKPYSPGNFDNAPDTQLSWVTTGDKEVKNIYMFDNAASHYTIGAVKPTKLVVKGTWKKDEAGAHSTYYPLTFRDGTLSGTDQKLQVTRNTKYIIQISQVHGEGYETLEQAKNAEDVNLKYEVIPWELNNDTEIIISENYWVSLLSRKVDFPRTKLLFRIAFGSNYSRDNMSIWDKDMDDFNRDNNNNGVLIYDDNGQAFCRVYIVKQSGDLTGKRFDFRFDLLRDYNEATVHTAKMKVKIGRIIFEMDFTQLDKDWGDWDFGGEIGWG